MAVGAVRLRLQLCSQMIHARGRVIFLFCSQHLWSVQQTVADNNGVDSDGNEIHQSVGECTQVLQDVAAGLVLLRRKSVAVPTCGHGEDVLSEAEEFSRDDYVSSAHLDISTHMYG
ncbi:hypothetical protein Sango_0554900 [Sesamum angolense]|uniref:Uncharacterized protein n=1 Tax=Sesamum angolense TaxID=2727404 RepID=A0AAE2C1E2_9LAMI|nr:hypothetical protein Sango_0554900 [Sesamum angolense]